MNRRSASNKRVKPNNVPINVAKADFSKGPIKRGRKPKGQAAEVKTVQCITLRVNDSTLNPNALLAKFIGAYLHYPVDKISSIDELEKGSIISVEFNLTSFTGVVSCTVWDNCIISIKTPKVFLVCLLMLLIIVWFLLF